MGLRLSVRESAWRRNVADVAASMPGLIPVVKGNGYGFGRGPLMPVAGELGPQIAVGTVYEAADVPTDRTALVLTPHIDSLPVDLAASAVLTVGSIAHVAALRSHGWSGAVSIKLQSTMRRYGVVPDELPALLAALDSTGLTPVTYAIHLPLRCGHPDTLAGPRADPVAEIETWLRLLDPRLPLSISHVDGTDLARLRRLHPDWRIHARVGTALWHGDKSALHLTADVLDVHPVTTGETVGYHLTVVPAVGHLALVAAGSAHGVRALDDGRSPFHFARRRLMLLEEPHMHTSLVFVPGGEPCPRVGDRVDVQRPLITTTIDELEWVRD